jgi:hypothetical protein
MLPPQIERSHVEKAIERLEAEGVPVQRTSKHWALEHNGKRFPPKLVVSLAAEMATGQALPSSEFSSGGPEGARSVLRRLGFSVIALDETVVESDEDEETLDAADIDRWLRSWYPDAAAYLACASLLADAIVWSHERGPACWVCATRGQSMINLTVGRVLVLRLQRETVSIVVAAEALTEEARAQLKLRSKPGTAESKSVEGSEPYVVAASALTDLRPVFESPLRSQISRAAASVKRTPYTRNQENQILVALENQLHRVLPRPLYAALPAPAAVADWTLVLQAFLQFRDDPGERFRVELRRQRAGELRALLAAPEGISPEAFNQEVWAMESRTLLQGQDITGQVFRGAEPIAPGTAAAWSKALAAGSFELHGNYVWGSGSRILGPTLPDEERVKHLRAALLLLNDGSLSPLEKATKLKALPGFEPNIATGLVMVFHPTEFSFWNKVSPEVRRHRAAPPRHRGSDAAGGIHRGSHGRGARLGRSASPQAGATPLRPRPAGRLLARARARAQRTTRTVARGLTINGSRLRLGIRNCWGESPALWVVA